jgi:hypothetical protein
MTQREMVERYCPELLAALKARGLGYYDFPKENWGAVLMGRIINEIQQEQQARAQAEQRKAIVLDALRSGDTDLQGLIFGTISAWPKERRDALVAQIAGPNADVAAAAAAAAMADGDPLTDPPIVVQVPPSENKIN